MRYSAAVFIFPRQPPADHIRPSPVAAYHVILSGVVSVGIEDQIIHIHIAADPGPNAVDLFLGHRHACRLLSSQNGKGYKKATVCRTNDGGRCIYFIPLGKQHTKSVRRMLGGAKLNIIPQNHFESSLPVGSFGWAYSLRRKSCQGIPFPSKLSFLFTAEPGQSSLFLFKSRTSSGIFHKKKRSFHLWKVLLRWMLLL